MSVSTGPVRSMTTCTAPWARARRTARTGAMLTSWAPARAPKSSPVRSRTSRSGPRSCRRVKRKGPGAESVTATPEGAGRTVTVREPAAAHPAAGERPSSSTIASAAATSRRRPIVARSIRARWWVRRCGDAGAAGGWGRALWCYCAIGQLSAPILSGTRFFGMGHSTHPVWPISLIRMGKSVHRDEWFHSCGWANWCIVPSAFPWWARRVSNPRPPLCKRGALPLSYSPAGQYITRDILWISC